MILKSHINATIIIDEMTVTYLVHTLLNTTSKVEMQRTFKSNIDKHY